MALGASGGPRHAWCPRASSGGLGWTHARMGGRANRASARRRQEMFGTWACFCCQPRGGLEISKQRVSSRQFLRGVPRPSCSLAVKCPPLLQFSMPDNFADGSVRRLACLTGDPVGMLPCTSSTALLGKGGVLFCRFLRLS